MTDRVTFLTADADVRSAVTVLSELTAVLDATHYERTEIVPLQGGPLDLALDPVNLARAVRGRSNALQASAVAGLYRVPLRSEKPGGRLVTSVVLGRGRRAPVARRTTP